MLPIQQSYSQAVGASTVEAWVASDVEECRKFFETDVSEKLRSADGAHVLRAFLNDLSTTGFAIAALGQEAESSRPPRDWEVGEVVAELLVGQIYGGWFPWPTSFDLRTKTASLPGPDLVGFRRSAAPIFAFGEIKSSSEKRHPPQVVTKTEDGLATQIRRLVAEPGRRKDAIEWLTIRGQAAEWRATLAAACEAYFQEPSRAWLVGVLVRGATEPNQDDLLVVAKDLPRTSHELHVVAIHLPFPKETWPSLLARSGGAA